MRYACLCYSQILSCSFFILFCITRVLSDQLTCCLSAQLVHIHFSQPLSYVILTPSCEWYLSSQHQQVYLPLSLCKEYLIVSKHLLQFLFLHHTQDSCEGFCLSVHRVLGSSGKSHVHFDIVGRIRR